MAEKSHPAGLRVEAVDLPWRSSSHHAPTTMDSLGHTFLAVIDMTAPTHFKLLLPGLDLIGK